MKRLGILLLEPYKGREIKLDREVWVYRNLMRTDGPWYSLMQGGLVVAHTRALALADVRFIVREEGRQRAIREKRKNVHAFVVGKLQPAGVCGVHPNMGNLPVAISYNPFRGPLFVSRNFSPALAVYEARFVVLNKDGCSAAYIDSADKIAAEAREHV